MQLNPLYYVEFRDIYPLRRSAAFKITKFWPLNKVEKALSDRKEVLCCSEAQKKILKDFNHSSLSPFHPQNIKGRFTGDPKLAGPLLGGQPLNINKGKIIKIVVQETLTMIFDTYIRDLFK